MPPKFKDSAYEFAWKLDQERGEFLRDLSVKAASSRYRFVFVLATDADGHVWFDVVKPDQPVQVEGDITSFKGAQWALAQLRRHADALLVQASKEDEAMTS